MDTPTSAEVEVSSEAADDDDEESDAKKPKLQSLEQLKKDIILFCLTHVMKSVVCT